MLTYIFPRPPTPTFPFHFLLFPGAVLDTDHGNIVSRPIPVSIDGHKMLSGYWQHVSSLPIQMHKHAPPSLALALPTRTGTLLETPRAQAALAQKQSAVRPKQPVETKTGPAVRPSQTRTAAQGTRTTLLAPTTCVLAPLVWSAHQGALIKRRVASMPN